MEASLLSTRINSLVEALKTARETEDAAAAREGRAPKETKSFRRALDSQLKYARQRVASTQKDADEPESDEEVREQLCGYAVAALYKLLHKLEDAVEHATTGAISKPELDLDELRLGSG